MDNSIGGGNVNDGTGSKDPGVPVVDSGTSNTVDVGTINDWAEQSQTTWTDTNAPAPYVQGDQENWVDLMAGKITPT